MGVPAGGATASIFRRTCHALLLSITGSYV